MAIRSVETDMSNSRRAFEDVVWPAVKDRWFDGAELEPVEEEDDSLKHAMDTIAGVDYWSVGDKLEPIASRVQNDRDISTFTVRMSRNTPGSGANTEFQKRLRTIQNGGLSPKWVIQAYVAADVVTHNGAKIWVTETAKLTNAAIAREKELIKWCDNGEEGEHFGRNGTATNDDAGEDEDFYYVHWGDYDKYRWLQTIQEPAEQPFARPFKTSYDPKTKEPPDGQVTLQGATTD